jgi:hypothetical protein
LVTAASQHLGKVDKEFFTRHMGSSSQCWFYHRPSVVHRAVDPTSTWVAVRNVDFTTDHLLSTARSIPLAHGGSRLSLLHPPPLIMVHTNPDISFF